jgi:phage-related protein
MPSAEGCAKFEFEMPRGHSECCVAKFDDALYVLHCFQKKTQKTSKADLNVAAQRYRDLLNELDQ